MQTIENQFINRYSDGASTYTPVSNVFARVSRIAPIRRDRRRCIRVDRDDIYNCDKLFAKNANPIQCIQSNCCTVRRRPTHARVCLCRARALVDSPIGRATLVLALIPPLYWLRSFLRMRETILQINKQICWDYGTESTIGKQINNSKTLNRRPNAIKNEWKRWNERKLKHVFDLFVRHYYANDDSFDALFMITVCNAIV